MADQQDCPSGGELVYRQRRPVRLWHWANALAMLVMLMSGLTMSPGIDAAWPWLFDLFGGRQSARSIHFICAMLLVGFTGVHLAMVVLAGPLNEFRSIVTGWYRLPREQAR